MTYTKKNDFKKMPTDKCINGKQQPTNPMHSTRMQTNNRKENQRNI
jgi:hypothetical protein